MNQTVTEAITLDVHAEQRTYPPYHDFHGTNWPMLWRRVTIDTSAGRAAFEQTDYGHPGRLNPWWPRGVPSGLTGRMAQLQALAESIGAMLD